MANKFDEERLRAEVTNIEWERVTVHITVKIHPADDFDYTEPLMFYAVSEFFRANARFKSEKVSEDRYRISLNYTNPGYCNCLPNGIYKILVCQGDDALCMMEISEDIVPAVKGMSRIFLHNKKMKGYTIDFSVANRDDALYLNMIAQDMRRCPIPVFSELDAETWQIGRASCRERV